MARSTPASGVDTSWTPVPWTRRPPGSVPAPVTATLPYAELKLEHPDLDATHVTDGFYPDAVPYVLEGESRIFYWRHALATDSRQDRPAGACATTHGLTLLSADAAATPTLVGTAGDRTELVVDGTVAGDSTTALAGAYDPPVVTVAFDASTLVVTTPTETHELDPSARTTVALPDQAIEPADAAATTVTPRLSIRYPGTRTLYHPAPAADYRLFPDFGLDLDAIPAPVDVPTTHDELDPAALAGHLDVDRDARPYAERVLWEAFAYAAFDPHQDAAAITRVADDLLAVTEAA